MDVIQHLTQHFTSTRALLRHARVGSFARDLAVVASGLRACCLLELPVSGAQLVALLRQLPLHTAASRAAADRQTPCLQTEQYQDGRQTLRRRQPQRSTAAAAAAATTGSTGGGGCCFCAPLLEPLAVVSLQVRQQQQQEEVEEDGQQQEQQELVFVVHRQRLAERLRTLQHQATEGTTAAAAAATAASCSSRGTGGHSSSNSDSNSNSDYATTLTPRTSERSAAVQLPDVACAAAAAAGAGCDACPGGDQALRSLLSPLPAFVDIGPSEPTVCDDAATRRLLLSQLWCVLAPLLPLLEPPSRSPAAAVPAVAAVAATAVAPLFELQLLQPSSSSSSAGCFPPMVCGWLLEYATVYAHTAAAGTSASTSDARNLSCLPLCVFRLCLTPTVDSCQENERNGGRSCPEHRFAASFSCPARLCAHAAVQLALDCTRALLKRRLIDHHAAGEGGRAGPLQQLWQTADIVADAAPVTLQRVLL